jgi:hypothetical protein
MKLHINESTKNEVMTKYKNKEEIETSFSTYASLPNYNNTKTFRVYTIYAEYCNVAEYGGINYEWVLAGYTDNGVLFLAADDINEYDLRPYMNGEVITDLVGIINAFPEQFYIETLYSDVEKQRIFDAWYKYCINNMPKYRNKLPKGDYTEYDDYLYNYWAGELRNKGISWQ